MSKYLFLAWFSLLLNSANSQQIEISFQKAIDSIYNANSEASGIMVHVESPKHGISWSGASGYADQKTKAAIDPSQPALIASSIKTYVSATILRLVELEKLGLEDPISNLITEKSKVIFSGDGYKLDEIQIKHLLSHTSGIEDYANMDYIMFKNENPNYKWTRDEQLELAIKVGEPLGKPGAQFSYADANYLLLTEIIEGKTGKSFFIAMRELLKYKELGIEHTWFPTLEPKPENTLDLVHQYWDEYDWDSYEMDISWDLYGGGGIACPTGDLAKFIYHYFNGNIVESDSIQNLIFTEIKTKETENYPYYLGLSEDNYHGMKAYGHGGFWGTVMMYIPDLDAAVSVYILDRDKRALRRNVMEEVTRILKNEKN